MTYYMIVIIIFLIIYLKKTKVTKVHPADSDSRHPGLEKSIVKKYTYKILMVGRKILFGQKELFLIL